MIEQNNLKIDKNLSLNNVRREFDEDELADFDSLFDADDDAGYGEMSVEADEPDLGDFPLDDVNDVFPGGESIEADELNSAMTASEAETLENDVTARIVKEIDIRIDEQKNIIKEISEKQEETDTNLDACKKILENGISSFEIEKLEQALSPENREKLAGENGKLIIKEITPFFEEERKKRSEYLLEVKEFYNKIENLVIDLPEKIKNLKNIQEYSENLQEKSTNNADKDEILALKEDVEEKYNEIHDFSEEYKEICEENKYLGNEIDNLKNELEESRNSINTFIEKAKADEEEKAGLRSKLEAKFVENNKKIEDVLAKSKENENRAKNVSKAYAEREKSIKRVIWLVEFLIWSNGLVFFLILNYFDFGSLSVFKMFITAIAYISLSGPLVREGYIFYRKLK